MLLAGCPPTTAACPAGFGLNSDGRCVAITDGGPQGDGGPMADAHVPPGDSGPMLDAHVEPDAGSDACAHTFFRDADGDLHGDATMMMVACAQPAGYVSVGDDCNDGCAACHPGASEICDGLDDDCDGARDNGFACIQNAPLTCTTVCGTMGTGTCSATCAAPTAATCSAPAEMCNGLDENCDGVADENLFVVSSAVTAIASGGTAASTFYSTHLVPLASGYMAFGLTTESPPHFIMQQLTATGAATGAPMPLGAAITATGGAGFSVRAAGSDFVITYVSASVLYIVRVNAAGGMVFSPFVLPAAAGTAAYFRSVIADADAAHATVYASFRTTTTPYVYNIRRFRLNTSGTTPSLTTPAVDMAGDLSLLVPFDVVSATTTDYVAYRNGAGDLRLVIAAGGDLTTPSVYGTVLTAAAAPGVLPIAIALADRTAPVSATNPLGIAWQNQAGSASATTHFVEVNNTSPVTAATPVAMTGGGGAHIAFFANATVQIVPVPNGSSGAHASHWLVASSDDDGAGGTFDRIWEVEGHGGAPTAPRVLAAPSPVSAIRVDISLVVGSSGIRLAEADASNAIVTRLIGCP